MSDLISVVVGFALTLFIYSYLFGDNPLYRLAVHVLIGVSAGYAAVVAVQQVILPIFSQIAAAPTAVDSLLWLVPIALGVLLLLKLIPAAAPVGDATVAALIGVGAAVALVGVVSGTLWPQTVALSGEDGLIGLATALLTICALLYFQFTGPAGDGSRPGFNLIRNIGRLVITISLGALFAGVLGTSLVLLAERIRFFVGAFVSLANGA